MPPKIGNIPVKKGEDSSYRYKMPRLTPRKVSSGNGVKTAILNPVDIAKALNRSPVSLGQWFGLQLGTQSKFNANNNQIIINGDHDAKKLQDSLYEYIDNFLLCPVCHNPETVLEKKGNSLSFVCRACGTQSPMPTGKNLYQDKMAGWFATHLQTEQKSNQNVTPSAKPHDVSQETVVKTPTTGEAGDYISVDELTAILKQLEPTEENAEKKDLTPDEFNAFFKTFTEKVNSNESDEEVYKFFSKTADECPWDTRARANMCFAALFRPDPENPKTDHCSDFLERLTKRRGLLIRFTPDDQSQKTFLMETVKLIETDHSEYLSSAPIVFYTLYENEIVEDKVIDAWVKGKPLPRYEKKKDRAVEIRRILEPFLNWMHTAEYEQETEEEEETNETTETGNAEPQEDDLNIDDI